MYEDILNVIYNYAFSNKLPDNKFIDTILNIVVDDVIAGYIMNVDYDYQSLSLASYAYERRMLRFNADMIALQYINLYPAYMYNRNKIFLDKSLFICLGVIEVIFHELEHVLQSKKINILPEDDFERKLLEIGTIAVDVYPGLYENNHDLFSIERDANINSSKKIKNILALDDLSSNRIKRFFNNRYNKLLNEYYSETNYPLLKFLTTVQGKLAYGDIPIISDNTEMILEETKKNLSFDERVLWGLPLDKGEQRKLRKVK